MSYHTSLSSYLFEYEKLFSIWEKTYWNLKYPIFGSVFMGLQVSFYQEKLSLDATISKALLRNFYYTLCCIAFPNDVINCRIISKGGRIVNKDVRCLLHGMHVVSLSVASISSMCDACDMSMHTIGPVCELGKYWLQDMCSLFTCLIQSSLNILSDQKFFEAVWDSVPIRLYKSCFIFYILITMFQLNE